MSCRLFFEVLLLVSFCCATIIAAVTPGLLPQDKCGVSSATDTGKVGLQEYPWIAVLKYKTGRESKATTRCTGTLINKRYVLTAAQCVKILSRVAFIEVTLGGTEKGAPPLEEFSVSENDVIVHPDSNTFANDIALIRLPRDADEACARNGGSPLTNQVDLDGVIRTVQYGLVSFGAAGCSDQSKEFPRLYTRITAYTDWILENIKA